MAELLRRISARKLTFANWKKEDLCLQIIEKSTAVACSKDPQYDGLLIGMPRSRPRSSSTSIDRKAHQIWKDHQLVLTSNALERAYPELSIQVEIKAWKYDHRLMSWVFGVPDSDHPTQIHCLSRIELLQQMRGMTS